MAVAPADSTAAPSIEDCRREDRDDSTRSHKTLEHIAGAHRGDRGLGGTLLIALAMMGHGHGHRDSARSGGPALILRTVRMGADLTGTLLAPHEAILWRMCRERSDEDV